MEYVYMILKRDLKSLIAPSGKRTLKSRLGLYVGIILYAALAGGIGYGTFRLFDYVRATLGAVPQLAAGIEINFLNAISMFMLVMVFMTGIQTTYKAIYESDDLGFLIAQPVPVQSIFLSKFISSYVSMALLALVFGFPAWLGYALAAKAGAAFCLIALTGLALLLLVAHSLISFLLLVAMRFLPGRKMKQLFVASTAIFGVLIVLLSQVASSKLAHVEDPSKMLEMIGKGQLQKTWYLPSTWMVNAVLGVAEGYGLSPLPYGVALVATSIGLSALSVRASRSWFLAGWSGRTEETGAGRKRSPAARSASYSRKGLPSGTFWTVLGKDLKILFRDPLIWYNLVIGAITVGFFIFNRLAQPGMQGGDAMIAGMAVLMGSITGAQTGGISVSREGASFWLLRGNPVDARGLFAAKAVYALLPPTVLFGLALTATGLTGLLQSSLGVNVLLGMSAVVTVALSQILVDVYFPDFTLKVEFGSSKAGRGTGKLTTAMLLSMAVVTALTFIVMLPSTRLAGRWFPAWSPETVVLAARVTVVGIAATLLVVAATFGVGRMGRILTDM